MGQQGDNLPRYDRRLREGKNKGLSARIVLGADCDPYTDDNYAVTGKIEEVDKFMLGLEIDGKLVWFNKSAIVSTEILP